jgi:uncharacterized protein (TIGR03083 family)
VETAEHIAALRNEGSLLAAAAAAAAAGTGGLDTRVPSCPEWVVRDLVRHQGGVHRWATAIVAGPRTGPWDVDLDDVVGTWPADPELLGWFRQGHAALVGELSRADPGLACWTFLAAPSPLAMWARRQAHETAVHRVDAELAAGLPVTPLPARFAADGIAELLACFITRPGGGLRADPPRSLRVLCTDTDDVWLVRIGPGNVEVTAAADEPDCQVSGRAADLYLALWNRSSADALTIEGDGRVLGLFRDRVQIRWS